MFPKKSKILEKLVDQSNVIQKCASKFREISKNWKHLSTISKELKEIESEADSHVHRISDEMEMFFILPLDKEDIKELSDNMDDIVDNLEQAGNRMDIYKMDFDREMVDTLAKFSDIAEDSVKEIHKAVLIISGRKFKSDELRKAHRKLHDLENKADWLHREFLERLMNSNHDALFIIKWKEIFQLLEDTVDKCEHIGLILERLRMKYR